MPEVQQFAPGANHAALIKPFYMLSGSLFKDYTREIKQTWKGHDGIGLSGGHTDKSWGKPSVVLTFGSLTRDEFAYLVTLKGPCTLRCRNEDTNTWHTYNAVLRQVTASEFNKTGNQYDVVTAKFIDLVQL